MRKKNFDDFDDPDNADDQKIPEPDLFLEKVKTTFLTEYFPVAEFSEGVIFMTTKEIYSMWQRIHPSPFYFPSDVSKFLDENNFTYSNMGGMRFEWMLKPVN